MGHQYVDGHEGTDASQASAMIVRRGERYGYFFWTSEETRAYGLVLPDVRSIARTVLTLTEHPAVVVIDKVIKIWESRCRMHPTGAPPPPEWRCVRSQRPQ